MIGTVVDDLLENSKAVPRKKDTEFEYRLSGEPYRCSQDLIDASRNLRYAHPDAFKAWQERCKQEWGSQVAGRLAADFPRDLVNVPPEIRDGHLASTHTVSGAVAFSRWLLSHDRKYLAVEMEAAGFLKAVQGMSRPARSLVLRGVSDFGDERKVELDKAGAGGLRRYAVRCAVFLLFALLGTGLFQPIPQDHWERMP